MTTERAVLAGGCFWGVQELLRRYDGVLSTRVGYTGGNLSHATYHDHGSHAEAVEVIVDPARINYRQILEFFFQIHDPSTRNRQGNDIGTSYRSAIFYTSDEQRRIAEDTIDLRTRFSAAGRWNADRRSDHRSPLALAKRLCFTLHLLGTFSTECLHPVS